MTDTLNPYDEVPYESLPIAESHPMRMATIAHLMGLQPIPVDQCRVLEIGCSAGGNVIPLAASYPQSEFVGIDYSAVQIEAGLPTIATLGLKNVTLKAVNVLDINPEFGQFDYIIVHGVYSWVPEAVRDKIMEVCARNLSPRGIAYVSYNTYPGWHTFRSIREMMLYHVRNCETPQQRVREARALLEYLESNVDTERTAYGMVLKSELGRLRNRPDHYLLHEHLETVNEPLYFHQFVAHAARHELQYVGDTAIGSMVVPNLSSFVNDTLRKVTGDRIEMEQYFDFLRNVPFRRTLLTHRSAAVRTEIELKRVKDLFFTSSARPLSALPVIVSDSVEKFRADNGVTGSTANRITKAAMVVLGEHFPQPLRFDKLLRMARKKLKGVADDLKDENLLAGDLLGAFTLSLVNLHAFSFPVQMQIGTRPRVSDLLRHQVPQGWVTSPFNGCIKLDEFACHLLSLLDGTRDLEALQREMLEAARQGKVSVLVNGVAAHDDSVFRDVIPGYISETLQKFVRAALLV